MAMKRTLMIIFILSYLYAPNHSKKEENNKALFTQLWYKILMVESSHRHYRNGKVIKSYKGAIGIAQVMPKTFIFIINNSKSYHLEPCDLYRKDINLWAGKWYFHYLYFDKFPGNWKWAVSAYNGGHNNSAFMTKYFNKVMNI